MSGKRQSAMFTLHSMSGIGSGDNDNDFLPRPDDQLQKARWSDRGNSATTGSTAKTAAVEVLRLPKKYTLTTTAKIQNFKFCIININV